MKKKKIYGDTVKKQHIASAHDRMHTFMMANKSVRGAVLCGTKMVNEMRANFELGIVESLALGHAYIGAVLMTNNLKGNDRLSLHIDCSGPLKGLSVEANAFGEVRGYLKQVPIPVDKPLESFNLSPFIGAGFLTVTKYLEDAKQPFSGNIVLKHGTIAKDLAEYFLVSEQIPTAFNLSVQFDQQGEIIGAGGLYLQAMPGTDDLLMEELESRVRKLPSLGLYMAKYNDPEKLINDNFEPFSPVFIDHRRIEFFCRCNEELIARKLILLPVEDLKDICENGPFPLEITCHNCNSTYFFQHKDIEPLYQERSKTTSSKTDQPTSS